MGAHRDLAVDPDQDNEREPPPVPVAPRGVYSREDSQRAWTQRRADLDDLSEMDDVLNEIDARAKDLDRRTAAVLVRTVPP